MTGGGRDHSLFVDKVDEEFNCAICISVLVNPVDTPCGHVFCDTCIRECLVRQQICPMDREPLTTNMVRPSGRAFKNLLGKLQSYCEHKDKKCAWKGEWSTLPSHLEKDCLFVDAKCKYACGIVMARGDVVEHELNCDLRMKHCQYCDFAYIVRDMLNHFTTCPMIPETCICKRVFPRKMFAEHQKNKCVERVVPCIYAKYGCLEKMKPQFVKDHEQGSTEQHLQTVMHYMNHTVAQRMKTLEDEVARLTVQTAKEQGEARNEGLRKFSKKQQKMLLKQIQKKSG